MAVGGGIPLSLISSVKKVQLLRFSNQGSLVQLVESPAHNWVVVGSNPTGTIMCTDTFQSDINARHKG